MGKGAKYLLKEREGDSASVVLEDWMDGQPIPSIPNYCSIESCTKVVSSC
jgi:hypothetical protein